MPTPEDKARESIDRLLTQAGWAVRNQSDANILAYRGVAIRNLTLKPGDGFADYLLYVDGRMRVSLKRRKKVSRSPASTRSRRDIQRAYLMNYPREASFLSPTSRPASKLASPTA
jgi:type I site-specific restriction endonuclease